MPSQNSKSEVKKLEIKYDHEGIPLDDPNLKGLGRYFNSCTIRGRANVAKFTIAALFGTYLYRKFSKSTVEDSSEG